MEPVVPTANRRRALSARVVPGGAVIAALFIAAILLAACNGDEPAVEPERTLLATGEIELEVPAGAEKGRQVVARSGCLACHRFGTEGNQGPGPNMTHVGTKLSDAQIRDALVNPRGIMPSYSGLSEQKLDALVAFLAALE